MGRADSTMFSFVRRPKEQRKAARRKAGAQAFIRLEGGFAVRPCAVIDLSESGVKIAIDEAKSVPNIFTFLTSRNAVGRRATVKWRRGSQIGAEFL